MDRNTELLEAILVAQALTLAHEIQAVKVAEGYGHDIDKYLFMAYDMMEAKRDSILSRLLENR
ncbi:hypothetical protein LT85_3845 [Collimonas arenae]|uniref:Uncharacterized protein n=1 Tax=Collimonas arenae TaxID=279058 RepID=A0A0A1FE17_9BURK|nr:hypothetical protein [Collimonas arenae]AIY43003.1 hypothetical protein LT85_3845 [Collimonas arenae]